MPSRPKFPESEFHELAGRFALGRAVATAIFGPDDPPTGQAGGVALRGCWIKAIVEALSRIV